MLDNLEDSEEYKDFVKKVNDFKKHCIPCYVFIKEEKAKETGMKLGKMYVATDIEIVETTSYFTIQLINKKYPCEYFQIVEFIYPN